MSASEADRSERSTGTRAAGSPVAEAAPDVADHPTSPAAPAPEEPVADGPAGAAAGSEVLAATAAGSDDGPRDEDDEPIRDPATGRVDTYVPELADTQRLSTQAAAGPDTPEAAEAPTDAPAEAAGNFPLWPDRAGGPEASAERRVEPRRRADPAAPPRRPRHPAVGLPLLIVCGLLVAFFAWSGAEPFWLSTGHSLAGRVRVTDCSGHSLATRCTGTFTAGGVPRGWPGVAVTGAGDDVRPGDTLPARMVDSHARTAYVGDDAGLTLRWALPLALVVLLGVAITVVTGAWRLRGGRRVAVLALSLLGPLALSAGILALSR